MIRVLFVCMGNICRSPTAEGVFRHRVGQHGLEEFVEIDSAGTHAYHIGNAPDRRAQAAALRRGIDISEQQARRVEVTDFETFDYILAMDEENIENLQSLCPPEHQHKVRLFLEFAPTSAAAKSPTPYYGGLSGFERVLDMIEAAAEGLIEDVKRRKV